LKTVLLDDADDTPNADREARLAEFLGDDVNRGVGIEEAMTDDLANDLVGAGIVAFGAGLVALESSTSMFTIEFEQLKISLFAEVVLLGGLGGAEPFALAFDEHGQAGDDPVVQKNGELSGEADDAAGRDVELHGEVLRERAGDREAGLAVGTLERIAWRRLFSLIDCGVISPQFGTIGRWDSLGNATNN
jgi:hypothetical protein